MKPYGVRVLDSGSMSGTPRLSPRFKPRSHLSTAARFGLTFEENAFVVAFCGKGRYNVERAAEVCGLTSERAWNYYTSSKIRRAIDARLKARSMSGLAIEAELSDLATDAAQGGRERVKALEVLAKVKGIGRDRALVLLERLMTLELEGRRKKLDQPERAALTGGNGADSPSIIDVSPVRAESALASGLELQDAAREREALTKEAQRGQGQDNGAAGISEGPALSATTQLALPLSLPRPQGKVDEPRSAVPSPDDDLLTR